MKKEYNALIYSMMDNVIVGTLKICSGMVYRSNSLISDGLHTMSDFITDIIALIGSLISKKRANKRHPLGYGKVEYITSAFIGLLLTFLGLYIIISSFSKTITVPNPNILIIIVIAILLKLVSCVYLLRLGKKMNSQVLIISAKESFTDIYSSACVVLVIVLLQFSNKFPFLKYADMLCSIFIGLIIIKMAAELIKSNIIALIGVADNNKEIINKVKNIISDLRDIKIKDVSLIMNGSYYQANILVIVPNSMSVRELIKLESLIKKRIIKEKIKIKFVNVDITCE